MSNVSKTMSYAHGKVSRGIRELLEKPKLNIGDFEYVITKMLRKGTKVRKVQEFAYKYLMSRAAIVASSCVDKKKNGFFMSYYIYDEKLKAFKCLMAFVENGVLCNYKGEHCIKFHALARVIFRGEANTMVQAIREIGTDNSYLLAISNAVSTHKFEQDVTVPTTNGYAILTHDPEHNLATVVTWITKKHAFENQVFTGKCLADWYLNLAESKGVPLIDIVETARGKDYFEFLRAFKKFTNIELNDWLRISHNYVADLHEHYIKEGNSDLNERQYFLDKSGIDLGEFALL